MVRRLTFKDIQVTPYSASLPWEIIGGPRWPDWERQVDARLCRRSLPVDIEPVETAIEAVIEEPLAWGGPAYSHFGHQLADFSTRLAFVLDAQPDAQIAFAGPIHVGWRTFDQTPQSFKEILAWFGVDPSQVLMIDRPTLVRNLTVWPQGEQLHGPGPTSEYLDILDDLSQRRLGAIEHVGALYVSRAGMRARLAGEKYLESAMTAAGITVMRPETLPIDEQVRMYAKADQLIFSEGSALHGLQLLGRVLANVLVIARRPLRRLAAESITPRARSVSYIDAALGPVFGFGWRGKPSAAEGISIVDPARIVPMLADAVPGLTKYLAVEELRSAQEQDVLWWFANELSPASRESAESHELLLSSLREIGMEHLSEKAGRILAAFLAPVGHNEIVQPQSAAIQTSSAKAPNSHSPRRLNDIARRLACTRYLEIGVSEGATFRNVDVSMRTAVDPAFRFDITAEQAPGVVYHVGTSDSFFSRIPREEEFDLVFIDGLHTFEQTYRDLCNVLAHSHHGTVILIDDTQPSDVYSALRDARLTRRYRPHLSGGREDKSWHGDVFKVVFAIHDFHPYLEYRTIVGSGNPQTLVWRGAPEPREPLFDSLERISRLDYFDMLEHADLMREASEVEAIELCLTSIRRRTEGPPNMATHFQVEPVQSFRPRGDVLESQVKTLRTAIVRRDAEIARMANSSSWRLTAPGRRLGRAMRGLVGRNGRS